MQAAIENETPKTLDDFLNEEINKELLRFTTAGSVDDGKSTLIGRLLHDCKAVYEDQLASVKKSPVNRSGKEIDFSLLTDGLRAEREQGITIDVAYRYFSTPRRKFIIADTPGHEQYTRNMATGASTADLAVVLIDASKGLLPQTFRHAYIASLLGIPRVLAAVNKMDLVGYSENVFTRLRDDFAALAARLGISTVVCAPISALEGDNIVERSCHTTWYHGPTLLEHLETVPLTRARELDALRFPVQTVIRPDANFRGFAGRIAAGELRPGDTVVALPSRQTATVEKIVSFDGDLPSAGQGESVVVKLAEEIDLSRGDMLVSPQASPHVSNRFAAMLVWLHPNPMRIGETYLAKHAGRYVKARPTKIRSRIDVNTLSEHPVAELSMNEIASVEFETSQDLFFDSYETNRITGSFILIDSLSNATVGAAMIRENLASSNGIKPRPSTTLTVADFATDSFQARIQRRGHRPAILTLTGEREHASALERHLFDRGFETILVNHAEIPPAARKTFYSTLWNLGIVILSWSEKPIRLKDRATLDAIAGEFHFHVSAPDSLNDRDDSNLQQAIAIAESLRANATKSWRQN